MRILLILPCLMGLACAMHTHAQEKDGFRYFAFTAENDLFVRAGDRHYTNGLRVAYGLREGVRHPLLNWLGALTPLADDPRSRAYEIAAGQTFYTPEVLNIAAPQPNDRPWAAWLFAELAVRAHRPGVEERLGLSLGVIGPAALGEETQRFAHDISNSVTPRGWDNQLRNEPALLIRYQRSWFIPLAGARSGNGLAGHGGLAMDLVPRIGTNLGNVFIDGGAGLTARFGSWLPERDLPYRLPPGLAGNSVHFDPRPGRIDWMIFAGAQVRGVAQNIFLDGNSFRDSAFVDRRPFIWDANIGVQFLFDLFGTPTQLAFTHGWRAREFEQQIGRNRIGSITLGFAF